MKKNKTKKKISSKKTELKLRKVTKRKKLFKGIKDDSILSKI